MTVARFMHYYSYKHHEVMQLKAYEYNFLVECMIKAKANDDLELIDIELIPHLKKEKMNKKINEIAMRAETKEQMEASIISSDQLAVGSIEDFIKEE